MLLPQDRFQEIPVIFSTPEIAGVAKLSKAVSLGIRSIKPRQENSYNGHDKRTIWNAEAFSHLFV